MSDSSSSDGEESKFKEICDPTLWRTAAERDAGTSNPPKQAADPKHRSESSERQSFMLLEKIKASLVASQTKSGKICYWISKCFGALLQQGVVEVIGSKDVFIMSKK